jgi:two-component system, NtrC family, sensor histidine kinase HydH
MQMGKTLTKKKIRAILLCLAAVSIVYYMTPLRFLLLQELFARLYYIPIVLGGLWFGLRGGLCLALLVTLICLPHAFFAFAHDRALFYDEMIELLLFNLVGTIVGILRDREHRQRAENERLQVLAALGETASSVAHEMKNRLIPIRGFLRRIRENPNQGAKVATYLQTVEQESAKLDKMVKDMLSFRRFSPLQRQDVAIGSLVEDIQKTLDEEFRENGVRLVCMCQEGERKVSLDPLKVDQALTNLLQNALQVSPKGKEVRLLVRPNQSALEIAVEDEGPGIHQEHLERIFQPFFTTKLQGTGLGLAITQRIVKEHGGKIGVESAPGSGTRFFLSFPIP